MTNTVEKLSPLYETATRPLPKFEDGYGKASDTFLAQQQVPFKLWETTYVWRDNSEEIKSAIVVSITVLEFGVRPGCESPTILFVDSTGQRCRGSASSFYVSEEAAQAEVDFYIAAHAQRKAKEELSALSYALMPQILEALRSTQSAITQG